MTEQVAWIRQSQSSSTFAGTKDFISQGVLK